VAVDVVLAVGGVDRPVQPLAVAAVAHRRRGDDRVVRCQAGQLDPAVDELLGADRLAVQGERGQLVGPEVEEGGSAGLAAREADRRGRAEGVGALVEVEVDLHGGDVDQRRAPGGLGPGEGRHEVDSVSPQRPEPPTTWVGGSGVAVMQRSEKLRWR
jgi:hypothetical protein